MLFVITNWYVIIKYSEKKIKYRKLDAGGNRLEESRIFIPKYILI